MNKPKFKAGKTLWSVVVMDNGVYHVRTEILSVKLKYDSFLDRAVPSYLVRYCSDSYKGKTSEFWSPCFYTDTDFRPNGYQAPVQYRNMYFNSERQALRYKAAAEKFLSEQA